MQVIEADKRHQICATRSYGCTEDSLEVLHRMEKGIFGYILERFHIYMQN